MKRQVFVTWFAVFIAWALFRAYFHLPEQVDEYLVKPLLFVIPVLAIVWVWEDKKLAETEQKLTDLESSFDELAFNTAKSVCCKAKVDNPNINSYEISNNRLVCLEGGEIALTC